MLGFNAFQSSLRQDLANNHPAFIVISLIVGIGGMNHSNARALAIKAGLVLLMFWVIGVTIFFSFQLAFPVLERASFFSTQDLAKSDSLNIIDLFIPYNPFRALSEGFVPAIVVFCLCLGLALMGSDRGQTTLGFIGQSSDCTCPHYQFPGKDISCWCLRHHRPDLWNYHL